MNSSILEQKYPDYQYQYSHGAIGVFAHKTKENQYLFHSEINKIESFQETLDPHTLAEELNLSAKNKTTYTISYISPYLKTTKEIKMKSPLSYLGYILCLLILAEAIVHFV